jgi:hypothetical protein
MHLCGPPWLKLGLALAMVLTIGMGNASAQLTDPQVSVSDNGATGSDPVQLGTTSMVTVTNQGSGSGFDLSQWYLILGVANTTSTIAQTTSVQITSVNGSGPTINGTFVTSMTSGQNAYSQLEAAQPSTYVPPADASESFTNWLYGTGGPSNPTEGDLLLGINAQSYSLFAYQINTSLLGGGTDTIGFNSNLPLGDYVIAYGVNASHTFSTPFTNAGLETGPTTAVPAPPGLALALSGCGAFGIFSLARRRKMLAPAA